MTNQDLDQQARLFVDPERYTCEPDTVQDQQWHRHMQETEPRCRNITKAEPTSHGVLATIIGRDKLRVRHKISGESHHIDHPSHLKTLLSMNTHAIIQVP